MCVPLRFGSARAKRAVEKYQTSEVPFRREREKNSTRCRRYKALNVDGRGRSSSGAPSILEQRSCENAPPFRHFPDVASRESNRKLGPDVTLFCFCLASVRACASFKIRRARACASEACAWATCFFSTRMRAKFFSPGRIQVGFFLSISFGLILENSRVSRVNDDSLPKKKNAVQGRRHARRGHARVVRHAGYVQERAAHQKDRLVHAGAKTASVPSRKRAPPTRDNFEKVVTLASSGAC